MQLVANPDNQLKVSENKMPSLTKLLSVTLLFTALSACSDDWTCQTEGKTMYSLNTASGEIGSADKGCSCDEIRSFEIKEFGRVDEDSLKKDFNCK